MGRSLRERDCASVARAWTGPSERVPPGERRAVPLQRSANGAATATTQHCPITPLPR
jgi:hypothetical protein